jgi:peptidyl-prolyl cis-trans isomerase C
MRIASSCRLVPLVAMFLCGPALGQQAAPPPAAAPVQALAAPAAATVNGQPIPESAVQRGLKRVPPAKHAEARPEILNFLIDNALIDQYLDQARIQVDSMDVEAKMKQVAEEIKKGGGAYDKVLQDLMLTEADLRAQITAQLRWEKFAASQATDPVLRGFFDGNRDMFDGTAVKARHILLTPPSGDPKASEEAKVRLAGFKKQIESDTAQDVAKLPAATDNLEREKTRSKLVEEKFAAMESACPSKARGGDLGWFPRAGNMVEPFAKTAFALKPYEVSDVVATQFGYHLILVTDRHPGKEVKFEEAKEEVREIYGDRLREALCAKLRANAQIVVNPAPK